jgi:hypothetical protein
MCLLLDEETTLGRSNRSRMYRSPASLTGFSQALALGIRGPAAQSPIRRVSIATTTGFKLASPWRPEMAPTMKGKTAEPAWPKEAEERRGRRRLSNKYEKRGRTGGENIPIQPMAPPTCERGKTLVTADRTIG